MADSKPDTITQSTEEPKTAETTLTEKATSTVAAAASSTAAAASSGATAVSDNIFAMFGGGNKPKREEKADEEDNEPSGSSKAKKKEGEEEEAPESPEIHFEPLVHLEKVEVKTNEEAEDQTFKMRAKLFKFDRTARDWKERGTGDVRLLKHKQNGKIRLVMRRDKTLKVCANHYIVSDMKLSPNVGSDRSWVWNTAADVSEGEPEAQTLAIRFANSENANLFKDAFLEAQKNNESIFSKAAEETTTEETPAAEKPTTDA